MSDLHHYTSYPKVMLEHCVDGGYYDPRFFVEGNHGNDTGRVYIGDRRNALRFRRTLNAMLKATAPPRKRRAR